MSDDNPTLCESCGERPATVFTTYCTAGAGVTRSTKLCQSCQAEQASPVERQFPDVLENGCQYCGAPAIGGGIDPSGRPHATCRSCAGASSNYLLRAFGLNPDVLRPGPGVLSAMSALRKRMTAEEMAEAVRKASGLEEFMRGRRVRYAKEAYSLVIDAVDRAIQLFRAVPPLPPVGEEATSAAEQARPPHVTPAELLEALRLLAIERFGSEARTQLRSWGVTRCEDFGEIVFRLNEEGLLGVRPEERPEDFSPGYDCEFAFS